MFCFFWNNLPTSVDRVKEQKYMISPYVYEVKIKFILYLVNLLGILVVNFLLLKP